MATIACTCCKRQIRADESTKLCWECRGRPDPKGAYVVTAPGERDPKCPHELPETVR